MSETANYDLYITDDSSTKFSEWRDKMNGVDNSNMVKIDAALAGKQDKLTGSKGQVVGFDDDGKAVAQDAPDTGVTTFNGRKGAVTPQSGDYTAEQVGARPNTWTPTAADVGALASGGTAAAATKLASAKTIRTNLASTSAASFDGTSNVTPGVTGVLPVANGGTGSSTEKYLPLAGGTMTGRIKFSSDSTMFEVPAKTVSGEDKPNLSITLRDGTIYVGPGVSYASGFITTRCRLSGIEYPLNDFDAAPKDYVDMQINSLKTSVSEGKAAIASAITDKGVSTSSTATFSTMASNIRAITSGIETATMTIICINNLPSSQHPGIVIPKVTKSIYGQEVEGDYVQLSSSQTYTVAINKIGSTDFVIPLHSDQAVSVTYSGNISDYRFYRGPYDSYAKITCRILGDFTLNITYSSQ